MLSYTTLCALIQGISEAFPVSSSFHCILLSYGMNVAIVPSKAMAAAMHSGSFLALCLIFRHDIVALWRGFFSTMVFLKTPSQALQEPHPPLSKDRAFFLTMTSSGLGLLVGMGILYGVQKGFFPTWNPSLTAMSLISIVFAVLLEWVNVRQKHRFHREPGAFSLKDSWIMGCSQALAAGCSGVSRLGIVLTAGRWLGYSLASSTRYGFIMGIPVLGASIVVSWREVFTMGFLAFSEMTLLTFLCSWPMIHGMLALSKRESTLPFTLYRVLLGFFILYLHMFSD